MKESYVPLIKEVFRDYGFTISDSFGYPLGTLHPTSVGIIERQRLDQNNLWERFFKIPKEYQLGTLVLQSKKYDAEVDSKWVLECFGYSRKDELYSLAKDLESKLGFVVVTDIKNCDIRTEAVDPCDLI